METEGVPEPFHHFTVTYVADEKVIREDTCSYGQPVSDHPAPEVPEKEGYYGEWEDIGEDSVTFDHVIAVSYTHLFQLCRFLSCDNAFERQDRADFYFCRSVLVIIGCSDCNRYTGLSGHKKE